MVTVENCLEKCSQKQINDTGDIPSKSASWSVIYDLCLERGMELRDDPTLSGLQKVVKFITVNTRIFQNEETK